MRKVSYKSDIKESNGMNEPYWESVNIETDYLKVYNNTLNSLCKLTSLPVKYAFFAAYNMDKDNLYRHDIHNKQTFIEIQKESEGKPCNIGSLDKIAVELVKVGIFTNIRRGLYLINPELFWKGDENLRVKRIREILESEYREKYETILKDKDEN